MIMFRTDIKNLLRRTKKIDKDGLTTVSEAEHQKSINEKDGNALFELLEFVGNSVIIKDAEKSITGDLAKRGINDSDDKIKVLTKYLAATQLLLNLEQIHISMFGSQISLLKNLNSRRVDGGSIEYLQIHFDHVQSTHEDSFKEWDLDLYKRYLLDNKLMVYINEKYHITELGIEYLTWIIRYGKNEPYL